MPWIVNSDGDRELVPDSTAQRLVGSGEWSYDKGETITVTSGAQTYSVPADQAGALPLPQEAPEARVERESQQRIEERYSTGSQRVKNVAENVAGGVTLGGSTALLRAMYGDEYARDASRRRQADPLLAAGSEIGGAVAAALATGGASAGATGAARGASMAARVLPAARADMAGAAVSRALGGGVRGAIGRGAAEGALYGAGSGLHEAMGADDPVTLERTLSAVGTGALTGAAMGGVAGGAAKGIEKAITGAGKYVANRAKSIGKVSDEGAEIVTKIDDYHKGRDAAFLLSKGESKAVLAKQGRAMRNALDAPETLARNPQRMAATLERENKVLRELIDEGDEAINRLAQNDLKVAGELRKRLDELKPGAEKLKLPKKLAAEYRDIRGMKGSGGVKISIDDAQSVIESLEAGELAAQRRAALDGVPDLLEQNQALRDSITDFADRGKGLGAEAAADLKARGQQAMSAAVVGAVGGGPIGMAAAFMAPKVVKRLADRIGPKITQAATEIAERQAKALGNVLDAGARVSRVTAPSASKVLANSSFGAGTGAKKPGTLLDSYKAREKELLDQVQASPEGLKMSRPARRKVADNLRGVKAVDPVMADRLETQAARRVEFLAGKLPRRPRVAVGNWQPPNSEIRKFARYVAAVEDPSSVLERAASGTISPEGAEALRTVYPEQFADIQRQVIEALPELRDKLPRDKRIALSILTGIPIDPAMEPRILARLQATYATEPGTEGGAQAPTPQPSFGSVSREQPTKAQRRAGDERTA